MLKAKLEAYRRQKRETKREVMISSKSTESEDERRTLIETTSETSLTNQSDENNLKLHNNDIPDIVDSNAEYHLEEDTLYNYTVYVLYLFFWACLYAIAIEVGFGAVYFILSAFVLMWVNTRSRPKLKGEPSAYSVFNPNCEAIEGTLDASDLEREIRYGIPAIY